MWHTAPAQHKQESTAATTATETAAAAAAAAAAAVHCPLQAVLEAQTVLSPRAG